jgi:predicted nucleotidyltransferase
MGTADGHTQLLAALSEVICSDPDVEFAIAFGSRAAGTPRPSSDIDVAVKFSDELSASERFRKRCSLSGELQREDAPFVDVSDIEELPLLVAYDAVQGTVLCGDEEALRSVKEGIDAAFTERGPDIRSHQRDLIDRIAEEGLRGR